MNKAVFWALTALALVAAAPAAAEELPKDALRHGKSKIFLSYRNV